MIYGNIECIKLDGQIKAYVRIQNEWSGEERMIRKYRIYKLKKFITCLKCEVSGKPCDDNCPIQYEVGTRGELIENLESILKIMEEQEPKTGHWEVLTSIVSTEEWYECSECGCIHGNKDNYCPNCGAKMEEEHG